LSASLSETLAPNRQEIELLLAQGSSLMTAKGMSSAEAADVYVRARDLCEKTGDTDRLFVALWNIWLITALGDIAAARPLSDRLLILTKTQSDGAMRLEAHHSAWFTRFFGGEPAPARSHCDQGLRLYDFERHRSLALLYGGHDPGICARYTGAWSEWLLGYPDTALASVRDAVRLAKRLAHPLSLDIAYLYEAVLGLFRRESDMVFPPVDWAERLATEQHLALILDPRLLRSSALLAQGETEQAVASIPERLAKPETIGPYQYRAYHLALLSEVLDRMGNHKGALASLADALAWVEQSGERWWEAEIHRLKGVSLLSQERFAESEASFEQSIQIARRQQAKSLELRGATSLARLWGEHGRRAEARELLAPVYGWFTEGFDTADLKEAAALLSELA
jgi:predicted ATPase